MLDQRVNVRQRANVSRIRAPNYVSCADMWEQHCNNFQLLDVDVAEIIRRRNLANEHARAWRANAQAAQAAHAAQAAPMDSDAETDEEDEEDEYVSDDGNEHVDMETDGEDDDVGGGGGDDGIADAPPGLHTPVVAHQVRYTLVCFAHISHRGTIV